MWSPGGDFINVFNRFDFLGSGHFLEHILHSFIYVRVCKFAYMQVSMCICVLKPEVNRGHLSSGATPNRLWRQCLLVGLRAHPFMLDRLARALDICLSPHPRPGDYKCMPTFLAFYMGAGDWIQVPSFAHKKTLQGLHYLLAQYFSFKRSVALHQELQATEASWENGG